MESPLLATRALKNSTLVVPATSTTTCSSTISVLSERPLRHRARSSALGVRPIGSDRIQTVVEPPIEHRDVTRELSRSSTYHSMQVTPEHQGVREWRRRAMTQRPAVERRHPPDALMRLVNPVVRRPARHGRAGQVLLVLHFTGRRSERQYDVPVGARDVDGDLCVFTSSRWRHNFADERVIEVTRGRLRERMRA